MKLKNIFSKNARFLYSREELNDAVYVSISIGLILTITVPFFILKSHNIESLILSLIVALFLFIGTPVVGFWIFMYSKYVSDKDERINK